MDRLRLPVLGLVAEDPVEGVADAGPDDRQPDRAADHRITVRHIPTPAASSSSIARAPSPGLRSTGAHASVRTCVSKPRRRRVERRRLDAVVGGEAHQDDPLDALGAEEALELGRGGLAVDRVAHREGRVAVLALGALADPERVIGDDQVRMELRAPRVGDAVDRPDAAVLREMWRRRRVPILGRHDDRAVVARRLDLAIDPRDEGRSVGHAQAAGRIGEIVLDIDHDEGGTGRVSLHGRSVAQSTAPGVGAVIGAGALRGALGCTAADIRVALSTTFRMVPRKRNEFGWRHVTPRGPVRRDGFACSKPSANRHAARSDPDERASRRGAPRRRRNRAAAAAPSYPMSADEASGTTTWGLSGTTGGSTSSR